jgi:putative exosortase-associated protein (TIGR04073 family)
MKKIALFLLLAVMAGNLMADIQMPPRRTFYDKFGSGLANVIMSPAEIFDSTYGLTMSDGPTVGWTKGLVQGGGRMLMDVMVGTFEILTSPIPTTSIKQAAYDTGRVQEYPPADLMTNWY